MKARYSKLYIYPAVIGLVLIISILIYFFLVPVSVKEDTYYIYIDDNDNQDSVVNKIRPITSPTSIICLQNLLRHANYKDKIKTGRYAINPGEGIVTIYRRLKNGQQSSLNLTIPEARTPNTYDIYWNVSIDGFLERMKKEHDRFWNAERTTKASFHGLKPNEVATLASIIDEETANNDEKPMIAGMYINRLKKGMPLQADPTVKFALKQFGLKRIYNKLLRTDSPYNTYIHEGLPPGPIKIASIKGIDAVLNAVNHDYLYMCAKEDFSGTHNFAKTYPEHLQNAEKYTKALNERGIK